MCPPRQTNIVQGRALRGQTLVTFTTLWRRYFSSEHAASVFVYFEKRRRIINNIGIIQCTWSYRGIMRYRRKAKLCRSRAKRFYDTRRVHVTLYDNTESNNIILYLNIVHYRRHNNIITIVNTYARLMIRHRIDYHTWLPVESVQYNIIIIYDAGVSVLSKK